MPRPKFDKPAHIIDSEEGLAQLVLSARGASHVAIDTESDGYYRHKPKMCLVQLTVRGEDYIIDPLAIKDLSALGLLLGDPTMEKIFHSGENDIPLLQNATGFELVPPYFDTRVAAQVAGIKGCGLAKLTQKYFDVSMDKKFQLHDWGARPLNGLALEYARADSHYLEELRGILWAHIEKMGREAQAQEEMLRLLDRPIVEKPFDPNGCLKIKGAQDLTPKGKKILMALFVLRDTLAAEVDLAPFRVIPNWALLDLSKAKTPTTAGEIRRVTRIPQPTLRRAGDRILDALAQGASPGAPAPKRPERVRTPFDPALKKRVSALKAWRNQAATDLEMEPSLVATNTLISALAKAQPQDEPSLIALDDVRKWQVKAFAQQWFSILE